MEHFTGKPVGARKTCSGKDDATKMAGRQPGYSKLTGGSKNKPAPTTKKG